MRPRALPARPRAFVFAAIAAAVLVTSAPHGRAQKAPSRLRGLEILQAAKDDLKAHYYDPGFHGMDVDARFKAAEEKLKTAQSYGAMFSIIAQALSELNDSHTLLIPPYRGLDRLDYGWRMQMIGDACYVTWVRPGGDAEAKGLRAGDEVLSLDGRAPTRGIFSKMEYSYYTLMPRPSVRLSVRAPGGRTREVEVFTKGFDDRPPRKTFGMPDETPGGADGDVTARLPVFGEMGGGVGACKVPTFALKEKEVDEMMKRAAGYGALVLDLRGNGGGYSDAVNQLVGYFFERDVKIADAVGRRGTEPRVAKTRGEKVFRGRLVVLVDSRSASASELFARVMQIERRAAVVGDRTAGRVMTSRTFVHAFSKRVGTDFWGESFGVMVTVSSPVMADGRSLEHVGVTPDETVLPTPADLAAGRDPALARAAGLLGINLAPDKAAALFTPK